MSRRDTSLRTHVFFPKETPVNLVMTAERAKTVGAAGFKKYEYILYILGQLARIVYCDAGIGRMVIEKALGLSPDIVNQVITDYDWNNVAKRRTPYTVGVPAGESLMETYVLQASKGAGTKYGTYLSTPDDFTAIVMDTSQIKPNVNATWRPTDVIVTIKGSSTLENFKHDLLSQFTPVSLETTLADAQMGFKTDKTGLVVPKSFLNSILRAWPVLKRALVEHVKGEGVRLFVTGHSLGGAYASLLTFVLALAKADTSRDPSLAFLDKVSVIHNVTFGAPTIVSDKARNVFNEFLKSGMVTLDRVVAQKVASRSAAVGAAIQGASTILSPNDIIPLIPAGFAHPGYRPLTTNIKPEAGGRPYSLENVRQFFGVQSTTRWREAQTWPFAEPMTLDKATIQQKAATLTGLPTAPDSALKEAQAIFTNVLGSAKVPEGTNGQGGGGLMNMFTKAIPGLGPEKQAYSKNTQDSLPNFLSVEQETSGFIFAHAGYMGMTYWGAFRMAGMKNPSKTLPAYFGLLTDGVKVEYIGAPKLPLTQSQQGGRKNKKSRTKATKGRHRTRKH